MADTFTAYEELEWPLFQQYSLMTLRGYLRKKTTEGKHLPDDHHRLVNELLQNITDTRVIVADRSLEPVNYKPAEKGQNTHMFLSRLPDDNGKIEDKKLLDWVYRHGLPLNTATAPVNREYEDRRETAPTTVRQDVIADAGFDNQFTVNFKSLISAEMILELATGEYVMFRETFVCLANEMKRAVQLHTALAMRNREQVLACVNTNGSVDELKAFIRAAGKDFTDEEIHAAYATARKMFLNKMAGYLNRIPLRPRLLNPGDVYSIDLLPSHRVPDLWAAMWLIFYQHITKEGAVYKACKSCTRLFALQRPNDKTEYCPPPPGQAIGCQRRAANERNRPYVKKRPTPAPAP